MKLPKLGYVKAKISMPIIGKINNATVERTPSGKYFCVLNVERPDIVLPNDGCMAGIDVGIKSFYADSNNHTVSNPKPLANSENKLMKEQRKLSRMIESHITDYKIIGNRRFPIYDKPLSECNNIQKQRIKIARLHERIANQRNDFLQKKSTKLVKENQLICIEELAIKNMVKNHRLAKSIRDVSWSKFFHMLEYKSAIYGTTIIKVPSIIHIKCLYVSRRIWIRECMFKNADVAVATLRLLDMCYRIQRQVKHMVISCGLY